MTDAEIIKALECCSDIYCCVCPYFEKLNCVDKDAIDLIKRQKEEIERLESRIFALNDTNKMLIDSQEIYWKNRVKEFAERLTEKATSYMNEGSVSVNDIDNLVKEMAGGK